MKLHVKNFGPIREAKVEIRPMTVFVGHSNTGKSYLAMLVYSIAKSFGSANHRDAFFNMFPEINLPSTQKEVFIDETDVENLLEQMSMRFVVSTGVTSYLDHIKRVWVREASFYFGEEWEKIAKQKDFSLVITDETNKMSFDLLSDKNKSPKVPDDFIDKIMRILRTKLKGKLKEKRAAMLKGKPKGQYLSQVPIHASVVFEMFDTNSSASILNIILDSLNFFPFDSLSDYPDKKKQNNMHYLPAGRGTIIESHLPITNASVRNAAAVYSGNRLFDGVTSDFVQKLSSTKDFLNIPDERKKIAIFADKMERRIAKGKIKVKISEIGYPHFSYAPENIGQDDISLIGASSAVSGLASVILCIRYYLSRGDIFIVEEPETNLHTVAQREIAALLVELVNAGVQVLITTHSDVILEQISNCLQASRLQKGSKTKVLHNAKLTPEKINVYTFVERKLGTKVQLVPPDEEDLDILSEDHTDVSSDLYNESVRIYNATHKNGN